MDFPDPAQHVAQLRRREIAARAEVKDQALAPGDERDGLGQLAHARRGNDHRSVEVGVDHVVVGRVHAEHVDRIAEAHEVDVGMARPDAAADDLEAVGEHVAVAERAVGDAALGAESLVDGAVHLAPEGAVTRPVIEVLDHDDGGHVRVLHILIPVRAVGNGTAGSLPSTDRAGAGEADNGLERAIGGDHRLDRETDGLALGRDHLKAVADRWRVPGAQGLEVVAGEGAFGHRVSHGAVVSRLPLHLVMARSGRSRRILQENGPAPNTGDGSVSFVPSTGQAARPGRQPAGDYRSDAEHRVSRMTARTALVTGANRGIGFEVCRQLAQAGMRVLLGARDRAKGGAAAAALAREGLDVSAVALDVADPPSLQALAAGAGPIDVLVNNAGVDYDTDQTALSADLARVRRTFETNLFGAWAVAQAFAPGMRERHWGRIVNVSSGAGSLAEMGRGPPGYSTSKAALNAMTRLLAAELAGTGVLVNSVCPGWVATDMGGTGGRPVRDGAASVVWAALLPDDGPSGGFFRDGKPLAW